MENDDLKPIMSIMMLVVIMSILPALTSIAQPPKPTVVFTPSTIYRGDPVTVSWWNFDDGVLGKGTLYTSLGLAVYSYYSSEGAGSIEFSSSVTNLLIPGQYILVVEQESVNKSAQAVLTVEIRSS